MFSGLFIMQVFENPSYFFAVVITVVISITLHELAHGWMAMRCGDQTPIQSGHMTGNPLVHMGPMSIIMLLVVGIAWGAMPIDPSRMRGKYAEAKVALAGPVTNLLLAIVAMTGIGIWWGLGAVPAEGSPMARLQFLLLVFGTINIALMLFNLLPIPPLDGSHILGNFNRSYFNFIHDPSNRGPLMFMFFFVFLLGGFIFNLAPIIAGTYADFVMQLVVAVT